MELRIIFNYSTCTRVASGAVAQRGRKKHLHVTELVRRVADPLPSRATLVPAHIRHVHAGAPSSCTAGRWSNAAESHVSLAHNDTIVPFQPADTG